MKVFKFGGASLKNAAGIKNVASIISAFSAKDLLVVVSAMGKTTNALEKIVDLSRTRSNFQLEISLLKKYHEDIMHELFPDNHPSFEDIHTCFHDLEKELERKDEADLMYDQIVSRGEIISSVIVHAYLT